MRVKATERTHKLPTSHKLPKQLGAAARAVRHLVLDTDQERLLQEKIPPEAVTRERAVS